MRGASNSPLSNLYPENAAVMQYADLSNRQQQNERSNNPPPKEIHEAALALT